MKPIQAAAIVIAMLLASCKGENDGLYKLLDSQLAKRTQVTDAKEQRLLDMKKKLNEAPDGNQRYERCEKLIEEYVLFNSDSTAQYIRMATAMADQMGRADRKDRCTMYNAYMLASSGNFSEAERTIGSVKPDRLDTAEKLRYYETRRWIYNVWEAYLNDNHYARIYADKAAVCLDSLVNLTEPDTPDGLYFRAEQQLAQGILGDAEDTYLECIKRLSPTQRRYASATCALAMVYKKQQRTADYEHYMLLAAIADQQIPLKENLALQELAAFLSNTRNDPARAQRYLILAVEDAIYYNSRLRLSQIARKLPHIAQRYNKREEHTRQIQNMAIAIMAVLGIAITITALTIYRQNRKLYKRRRQIIKLNKQLKATNRSREQYVGLFIELCAAYIEKYNRFHKAVERKVKAHQTEDLPSLLHTNRNKDTDAREFFANFDRAFLKLYPDFIEQLNALLKPDYRLAPRSGELLGPELRIMALIRLGVNETTSIATLLLYAPQTIYNYRSAIKSHAIDKDHFEADVALLCQTI